MAKSKSLGYQIHSALAEINYKIKKKGQTFLTRKMTLTISMLGKESLREMEQA